MPEPLLEVRDLHAWYGESHVLHGVDLEIRAGETVTLLGRNGAGKTTSLKSVMGIVGRRRGSVRLEGRELIGLPSNQIARLIDDFEIRGVKVGGDSFVVIAGPCAVETEEQTLSSARAAREAGASMLRGGAFKPRTSPFAFKGLGVPGLEILAEARAETGLPVVTELLDTQHADVINEHADVVQIGARNMQNYALLEVAGKLGKPVLLKRGLSSSLDELLQAADYILKEGNEDVILCERGIRTFETATRFTLDLGAVPWLKLHSHLPVIVDPSHAAGDRRLVEPLSRAAAAVGADGIIVEVAEDPEAALCDGPQALYASAFAQYAQEVAAHAALLGKQLA
jgi:3-deoxy-7-phosphoheptulonate synthase